jgi:hypothetical protein
VAHHKHECQRSVSNSRAPPAFTIIDAHRLTSHPANSHAGGHRFESCRAHHSPTRHRGFPDFPSGQVVDCARQLALTDANSAKAPNPVTFARSSGTSDLSKSFAHRFRTSVLVRIYPELARFEYQNPEFRIALWDFARFSSRTTCPFSKERERHLFQALNVGNRRAK